MKPRLKRGEAFAPGLCRLIAEQVDRLASPDSDLDEHAVRVSCKRVRAWLRLLRPSIGDAAYHVQNLIFRDAARRFSASRDARVMGETITHLREAAPEEVSETEADNLRRRLAGDTSNMPDLLAGLRRDMADARARFRYVTFDSGHDSAHEAFRKTWKRFRRAGKAALADGTAARRHEWRKQAKYLRYQLDVLKDAWPGRIRRWERRLKALADRLGADHDYVVLADRLTPDDEPLRRLIQRLRRPEEADAVALAKPLLNKAPGQVAIRLGKHLRDWAKQ